MPGTPVSKLEMVRKQKKQVVRLLVFTTLEFNPDFIDKRLQELAFQYELIKKYGVRQSTKNRHEALFYRVL